MGMKPTKTEMLIRDVSKLPKSAAEDRVVVEITHQYWNLDATPSRAEINFLRKLKKKRE